MALPKSHRLSLRFNRERLTNTGKTFYGKFFTLVVSDTPESEKSMSPRLAILLSKKTATFATDRNKIKRITSALLENLFTKVPRKDYMIIPKNTVLTEKNDSLLSDIKRLISVDL